MNGNTKITLDKYLTPCGAILQSDKLTLDDWYLLEAVIQEANKLSGGNFEEWKKITGRVRPFDDLIKEVEGFIKKLGGKVKAERERESKMNPNAKCVSRGNVKKLLKMAQMMF